MAAIDDEGNVGGEQDVYKLSGGEVAYVGEKGLGWLKR
jgi:hypothetical protein